MEKLSVNSSFIQQLICLPIFMIILKREMQGFTEQSYPEGKEDSRANLHQQTCSHSDVPRHCLHHGAGLMGSAPLAAGARTLEGNCLFFMFSLLQPNQCRPTPSSSSLATSNLTLVLNTSALPAPATSLNPLAPINVTPAYFRSILNVPSSLPDPNTIPIGPVNPALTFLQPPSPQFPLLFNYYMYYFSLFQYIGEFYLTLCFM